jgi:hypothetical protein
MSNIYCPQPPATKIFCASRAFHLLPLHKPVLAKTYLGTHPQMARIHSTAKLFMPTSSEARQDTMPISEAMRASSSSRPAQGLSKDRLSKPSHIEIDRSILKEKDLQSMKKLGYFNKVNMRLPRDETTLNPKKDKVIVYKSFFKARLWLSMYQLIAKILQRYEIYMHQLTPNAIVCLGVFIWAIPSQGGRTKLMLFAGFMIYIIGRKLRIRQRINPRTSCIITSDATTSCIAMIQLLRSSCNELSGMRIGRRKGFT